MEPQGDLYSDFSVSGESGRSWAAVEFTYTYAADVGDLNLLDVARLWHELRVENAAIQNAVVSEVFPAMERSGLSGTLYVEYAYLYRDKTEIASRVFMRDATGEACNFDPESSWPSTCQELAD